MKVSLTPLRVGGEANVIPDSYDGLEENDMVTVVMIDGDNVVVEDETGVQYTVLLIITRFKILDFDQISRKWVLLFQLFFWQK